LSSGILPLGRSRQSTEIEGRRIPLLVPNDKPPTLGVFDIGLKLSVGFIVLEADRIDIDGETEDLGDPLGRSR
jgi:hypothetical protein